MAGPSAAWGTCTLCGDAVPAGATACPTCGYGRSVGDGRVAQLGRRERWRLRSVQSVRVALVVGVVGFLAYLLVSAVATGPPTYTDPLTGAGTYHVAPSAYVSLSGAITGEDYIVGNYTVASPAGALASLLVLNDSEYDAFVHQKPVTPLERFPGESTSRIVFAAPYTDTFHFVFENQYPVSSGLTLSIYVVTNYESNVVLG